MAGVVRKTDKCSGHDACPPRESATGSTDVFVNKISVERYGDTMEDHGCIIHPPHSGIHVGTHSVYINGRSIQIEGDPITCGSTCAEHSDNVFVE